MKWLLVVTFLTSLPGEHGPVDYQAELGSYFGSREGCVAVGQALTRDNVGIVGFRCVDDKGCGVDPDDIDALLDALESWAGEAE